MKYSYRVGAKGSKLQYELGFNARRVRPYRSMAVLCCLMIGGVVFGFTASSSTSTDTKAAVAAAPTIIDQTVTANASASPTQFVTKQRVFTPELQQFLKKRSGSYGVAVGDINGTQYADINADKVFPSASIYKLYVAYAGYQLVDSGKVNGAELYQGSRTRLQCLDAMIRTSDSPCAEKMAAELGKSAIDVKLKAYGITNTSVRSLTTTARDASRLLVLIQLGTDLSADSRARLIESMQYQKYRNGLPKGFANATVYNKVGFRDLVEYNDVALVSLADGRIVTVAVLTENVGVKSIAKLAAEINRLLLLPQ